MGTGRRLARLRAALIGHPVGLTRGRSLRRTRGHPLRLTRGENGNKHRGTERVFDAGENGIAHGRWGNRDVCQKKSTRAP